MAPTRAISVGAIAERALSSRRPGRVAAVFRRSLYLEFGEEWACLGNPEIGHGPLNIPCLVADDTDWRDLARPGAAAISGAGSIQLDHGVVDYAFAPVWSPAPLPAFSTATAASGLAALEAALPADLPEGGLAEFLRGVRDERARSFAAVAKAAAPAVGALGDWVRANASAELPDDAVRTLIGLGPGVTPSGDDLLAGLAVTLHAAGRRGLAQSLARRIISLAPALTHELSTAHLRAAFAAGLREDVQEILHAVLADDHGAIGAGVLRLHETPHHSCWDTLAGIVLGLRALLNLPALERRAS